MTRLRLGARSRRRHPPGRADQHGAATVELVLIAIPILMAAVLITIASGRLVQTQLALGGVTRDAARVAVTATSAPHATELATRHAQQAAAGYGLDPDRLTLTVTPGTFARGDRLEVAAAYDVALLPGVSAHLTDTHAELIDPYASRAAR